MYNDKEVDIKSKQEVVNIVNFVREGLSISELSGRIRELILEYKEEEKEYNVSKSKLILKKNKINIIKP